MTDEERDRINKMLYNADGSMDFEMLDILSKDSYKKSNDAQMEKALELTAAGWTPFLHDGHLPHPFTGQVSVMSWWWRRPPRRQGKPGMMFKSTDQAYNSFKRSLLKQGKDPNGSI